MDTPSPVSRPPLTDSANLTSVFEDELVLAGPSEDDRNGAEVAATGGLLPIGGRGRVQDNQAQKKGQSGNKIAEERKRYHINSVK